MHVKNATPCPTSMCFYGVEITLKEQFLIHLNKTIPALTKNKYALLESDCAFHVKDIFFSVQTCI